MGMAEGYLVPDIPESNGWIFSPDAYHHGYYVWNKYASSGGHLTGKSIISSEAMTNTHGVFQTTLEYIKHDDDMNFIMGINHSVLHGFNYSPPEAGFPGWVRYGTYFSEQNSWWQYFKYWAEYNARLSAVFQYCKPVVDVAILAPTADWLSTAGLARVPFHLQPWYCHRLWEPIHQIGGAADYLSEKVIQESDKKSGKLKYGAMAYKMLILPEVETIKPETAQALEEFASVGGKIIFVAKQPSRSPCLKEAALNDQSVKNAISEIIDRYPRKVAVVSKPIDESDLIPWTEKLFHHFEIKHPVHISPPNENVFQIHHECEGRDIFFFVNSNFDESIDFKAVFQTETKTPWRWDAETGQRTPFAYNSSKNRLTIHLEPLESLLLVFEPQLEKQFDKNGQRQLDNVIEINGSWHVRFEPMFNTFFEIEVSELDDLSQSQDMRFANFAGTVIYQTDFKVEETESYLLDLGNVYGVSEVKLNDQPLGIKWYGRHRYLCSNAIVNGENHLEIKITTVLLNYVKSLTNNPTAQIWTQDQKPVSVGLVGPVRLNSSK